MEDRLVREAGAVAALVAMAPAVAVAAAGAGSAASVLPARVRRPAAGAVWVGAGAVWAGAVGTGVGAVCAGVAGVGAGAGGVGSALGAGSGGRLRRLGAPPGSGCGSTGTGFSGSGVGGGGGREVVPGIVGMLGGRRVGDVATAVVLDARVVLDHARRRLGLRDDGRDVLARAGVGPGLLLGEVGRRRRRRGRPGRR